MKFNVDSLEFREDESVDFEEQFDLGVGPQGVELSDIVNGTTAFLPQDVGTDLVGGKFAQTVDEGKALADDGTVYNTIQRAVDNASSWVKVGPGQFHERVEIGDVGKTVVGCGDRTEIIGYSDSVEPVKVTESDITIADLSIRSIGDRRALNAPRSSASGIILQNITVKESKQNGLIGAASMKIINCTVRNTDSTGINANGTDSVVVGCSVTSTGGNGITAGDPNAVVVGNRVSDVGNRAIYLNRADSLAGGNRIDGCNVGVYVNDSDCIVFKNRISNANDAIDDRGTGTVLSANLVTPEDEE